MEVGKEGVEGGSKRVERRKRTKWHYVYHLQGIPTVYSGTDHCSGVNSTATTSHVTWHCHAIHDGLQGKRVRRATLWSPHLPTF